jgi:hypothetical protein
MFRPIGFIANKCVRLFDFPTIWLMKVIPETRRDISFPNQNAQT